MKASLFILYLAAIVQIAVLQEEAEIIADNCSTKQCPGRQACIENVKDCPSDSPNCGSTRKQVEAVCVTMEMSLGPTSCDDIVCAGNGSCIVLQTANGTKAMCKDVSGPMLFCKDIECDGGMRCVERMQPKCIPIRTEMLPTNCSQLECPEGLVCMLLMDGAKCAKLPTPRSCEELDCPPGLMCKVMRGERRAKCVQEEMIITTPQRKRSKFNISRDCSELDCEDGYRCQLVINRKINGNVFPIATCMPTECPIRRKPRPPVSCAEVECRDDEVCMVCGKGADARARCMVQRENATMQDTTSVLPRDSNIETRGRPPVSCDELICGPREVEKCQVIRVDNEKKQIALCIPNDVPEKCEDARCDNKTETCLEVEMDKRKMAAVCIPARINKTVSNRVAPQPMNRRRQPSIRRNGQIPKPAESCEQLDCDRNSECLQMMKNGKRRALCMKVKKTDKCVLSPEEGEMPMAGFNSTTVGLSLPDTCQERRCCEGETCIVQSTGDNSLPLAVCIPIPVNPDGIQSPPRSRRIQQQPLTCEELMCEGGFDCIVRQQQQGGGGEGEGEGGRRMGAICKRRRRSIDDRKMDSRVPSDEGRRFNDRRGPLRNSGGRSNNN